MTVAVPTTRDRLLDAAHRIIEDRGWSAVTMGRVAEAAGVSRQTVYNELGAKRQLAEHLAMRELGRFLEVVRVRLAQHEDLADAVESACRGVLEVADASLLIRTIVSTVPRDQDPELLAILTVESGGIVEAACSVVTACVVERGDDLPFDDEELAVVVETVVRLVLSAITRPSKGPAQAAADIAWILRLALAGARSG